MKERRRPKEQQSKLANRMKTFICFRNRHKNYQQLHTKIARARLVYKCRSLRVVTIHGKPTKSFYFNFNWQHSLPFFALKHLSGKKMLTQKRQVKEEEENNKRTEQLQKHLECNLFCIDAAWAKSFCPSKHWMLRDIWCSSLSLSFSFKQKTVYFLVLFCLMETLKVLCYQFRSFFGYKTDTFSFLPWLKSDSVPSI